MYSFIICLRDTLSDSIIARDHDGTGTASTLTANKLCTSEMGIVAEVGEEGHCGVRIPDLNGLPVDVDEKFVGPALCESLDIFCHFL